MTSALPVSDRLHLRAAESWLTQGNHLEADEELNTITPALHTHPEVLDLHWQIYARIKRWDECLDLALVLTEIAPTYVAGWMALAHSFYGCGQIQEAYNLAVRKLGEFPASWHLLYDTARYAFLLGQREESKHYLRLALACKEGKTVTKRETQEAANLEPFWN